ncbi:MAG: hypothetical protein IJ688_06760 [Treponema sp.]|nr:hypothetical protein [Treponema sp.]
MKKILITICALTAFLLPLTAQSGLDFSGEVESSWGAAAPWTDSDTAAGRFLLGNTSFTPSLEAYWGNSSAFVQGSLSYDATSAGKGLDALDFSLDEVYLDYSDSFWGIRIGRQKAAWGKADGVDITNIICPSDMSSFAAMTSDDSKLAVDAVRLSFSGSFFTADFWWIPFFTPSALPLEEGNSLRKFLVPASVEFPLAALNTVLTLPVNIASLEEPELALWNGEYALKLSGYLSALDFSLYGFYGWDDLPFLDYTITYGEAIAPYPAMPNGITVSGTYKRMAMIGADAALPLGETVIRLETAFFPQRHFQKSASSIMQDSALASAEEKRNELSALAGIDWMPSGWTITAQYFCDAVFGDLENLEREEAYTHGATLSISKSFVNETLETSLSALVNFGDFDSLISPSVSYSLSDQIKFSLGAYIFIPGPEEDGEYGAYKDLSSIYLNAKFSF